MDLSIKLLKNVAKALIVFGLFLPPAFAKKTKPAPHQEHNHVLATSYVVQDLDTGEIITEKNINEVRSIASITKLMTAVIVLDARQNLEEVITFHNSKGVHSRLPNGTKVTRSELLLLSLMSSDNVAAKLLAQHYPGGEAHAIAVMNSKAISIGMTQTKFSDPTGLHEGNVSTAQDLAKLLDYAYNFPIIRDYSTRSSEKVAIPTKKKTKFVDFRTTNKLVTSDSSIALSKTGWIQKSGGCLVMIVKQQGRRLAVILLNSKNTHTRIRDGVLLTEYNNVRNYRNLR